MAIFYPQIDFFEELGSDAGGRHAELMALRSHESLNDKWRVFHGFQWRKIDKIKGEQSGEADIVIFHLDLGIIVIEIKGGGVIYKDGEWFYEELFSRALHNMGSPYPFWSWQYLMTVIVSVVC